MTQERNRVLLAQIIKGRARRLISRSAHRTPGALPPSDKMDVEVDAYKEAIRGIQQSESMAKAAALRSQAKRDAYQDARGRGGPPPLESVLIQAHKAPHYSPTSSTCASLTATSTSRTRAF